MTVRDLCEFVSHAINFTFHRVYLVTFPSGTLTVDVSGQAGRDYLVTTKARAWLEAVMPNRWQNHTNRQPRDFGLGGVITVDSDVFAFCRLEDAVLAEVQWGGTLLHG